MVLKKIQFKEKSGKRYYDFSTRKLETLKEAIMLKQRAEKDFPQRKFKIKNKY